MFHPIVKCTTFLSPCPLTHACPCYLSDLQDICQPRCYNVGFAIHCRNCPLLEILARPCRSPKRHTSPRPLLSLHPLPESVVLSLLTTITLCSTSRPPAPLGSLHACPPHTVIPISLFPRVPHPSLPCCSPAANAPTKTIWPCLSETCLSVLFRCSCALSFLLSMYLL